MSENERAAREQVRRSTWRLYLAIARCPSDCPKQVQCIEQDGCPLLDWMKAQGEMEPRAWEGPGWEVLFAERVRKAEMGS